jgi:SAM-dependent methyltransferase
LLLAVFGRLPPVAFMKRRRKPSGEQRSRVTALRDDLVLSDLGTAHADPGHDVFDLALRGAAIALLTHDGRELPLDPVRWYLPAAGEDQWLLDRCPGSTLDLGCGPGRLVVALGQRGVPVLGIDCSRRAVRECRARGGAAVRRDLFRPLPEEGSWDHVLLADGNIGIGGDPMRLLGRAATAVREGGSILVETAGPGSLAVDPSSAGHLLLGQPWWRGRARLADLDDPATGTGWFPWAVIGTSALVAIAQELGLTVGDRHCGQRHFVELYRPADRVDSP